MGKVMKSAVAALFQTAGSRDPVA